MTSKTILLWYVPVIHQGYVNVLHEIERASSESKPAIYLFSPQLVATVTGVRADLATLAPIEVAKILKAFGWPTVEVMSAEDLKVVATELPTLLKNYTEVILIDDQFSRSVWAEVIAQWPTQQPQPTVVFESVFLRWDTASVQQSTAAKVKITMDGTAQKWMQESKKIAQKSSDWWRQVGSIAVKNDSALISAYNQGMPTDHTPYQQGAVRDYVRVGEQPELANYIHAEQAIVAAAAAKGVSLAGADLYVTHFPCPVCAKLIAKAGFARVFFSTGSATLDGQGVLESYEVELLQVGEKSSVDT